VSRLPARGLSRISGASRHPVRRPRGDDGCDPRGGSHRAQRSWGPTSDVLVETCACIERAERDYTEQIATIRASSEPEDRKARKIAKREQLIANGRRQMATSWFNIAVASYNLSRTTEARQ
jgi:hypothetical protein